MTQCGYRCRDRSDPGIVLGKREDVVDDMDDAVVGRDVDVEGGCLGWFIVVFVEQELVWNQNEKFG